MVEAIEQEIARVSIQGLEVPTPGGRCFPYVQLHELEAIFFSEPAKLAMALEKPQLGKAFEQVARESGGCELINDRPQSAPSKRIETAAPHYIKGRSAAAHAPIIAKQLGLAIVRQQCPRFDVWVKRLESI